MEHRTVSLREDVYRKLQAEKRGEESDSEVVERLLAAEGAAHPLRRLQGLLDENEAERVREDAAAFRAALDEEMERHR